MWKRRGLVTSVATTALVLTALGAAPSDGALAPRSFKNCKALNRTYPHGVGRRGARDKTSDEPVTNFKVSTAIYRRNRSLDRDHDGIACEKH